MTPGRIGISYENVGFWGEGKTEVPGEKPLGAKARTNNKLNPHLASTPGFERTHETCFLSSRATCKDEEIKPSNTRLHLPPNTFGLARFRCTIKDVNNCMECNDTAIFPVNVLQKKGNTCLNTVGTADIANNIHNRWICISHYFRMLWAKIILQSKYSISLEFQ